MTKAPNIIDIESDIAKAVRGPTRLPSPVEIPARAPTRSPAAPEYVEHKEGVPDIGRITAEAVAIDYEAAAKEIEELGKQLTDMQKRVEVEAKNVHTAIAEVKVLAQNYRDEGLKLFNRLEEAALLTKSVRETCTELASKIGGSK